tara:strand:+ start:1364 stop:2041 length:678 start_codon:yes stop_codon:yes gene_type:complete
MIKNLYEELGLNKNATQSEIKSSYRRLVKKHHPDVGGEKDRFLAIQDAWEKLSNPLKKEEYDKTLFASHQGSNFNNENWEVKVNLKKHSSTIKDNEVKNWINNIYSPINRFISQIIKPLSQEIRALSADPYDEELMDEFCNYIALSQRKIEKVDKIYKSMSVPNSISSLGLDLYHCFSQVKDALSELDKYTKGYVDNYLFDGKEMMKEAKRIQSKMAYDKKSLIS